MTKREFAALAARLMGIYLFVRSLMPVVLVPIFQAMQIQSFLQNQGASFSQWLLIGNSALSAIAMIFPLLIGLLLWFKADAFAARLFPQDSSQTMLVASPHILPMAFAITGVIIIALTFPHLLGMFIAQNLANNPQMENSKNILDLPATLIQVILGIWLIFGAGKISTTIKRALNLTRDQ